MRFSLVMVSVLLALMPLGCAPRIQTPDSAPPTVAVALATAVVEPVVKVLSPTAPSVTATLAVAPTAVATEVAVEPTVMQLPMAPWEKVPSPLAPPPQWPAQQPPSAAQHRASVSVAHMQAA